MTVIQQQPQTSTRKPRYCTACKQPMKGHKNVTNSPRNQLPAEWWTSLNASEWGELFWAFLTITLKSPVNFVLSILTSESLYVNYSAIISWVWHLYNLLLVSELFWLISIARYVFKSPSICFRGTEHDVYCERVAYLHYKLWRRARLWLELFASAIDRLLSRVSYVTSHAKTFFTVSRS